MIVECRFKALKELIGKDMTAEELEEILFLLKAEVESFDSEEMEIEVNPDRQDMLSPEGIARAVKSFVGISPGLREFPVQASGKKIAVEPGLEPIRQFIACGIVTDLEIDNTLVKDYMHLQENLTATHGRNRKKASIGLYVYDDIEFPVTYKLQKPEEIEFVPLGLTNKMNGPTIVQEHEKGIEYGPIISDSEKWPLLVDAEGKTLSLPPIINSNDLGRITDATTNVFVEVTGTHKPTVDQALNIMVTALAERRGEIKSVEVEYPDGKIITTPDLEPQEMTLSREDVITLTGLDLNNKEIVSSLNRMGYSATAVEDGVDVLAPAYRTDILHEVDLIEDVAIGYGFDRIVPTMPETMTVGKLLPIRKLKNRVRDLMIGMGYQEIMSYVMSSPEVLNEKALRDGKLVKTGNPKSKDYSCLRNSLLPILLDFVSKNQHADYPQRIFEVGDVVIPDAEKETRTEQPPEVCGMHTDTQIDLTKLLNHLGFLLRNLGLANRFEFKTVEDSTFINGRAGNIVVDGEEIGIFGEIHPEALEAFRIGTPVMAFELRLPRSGQW
ncbi:MAG: phenylalanine--tRNA ligase subunit beta [Candidatus Lokiarchaeota archaeon]|nr:phenylalanine--tRNA ligase subunit beta [Candidatus Lokiarchaeota archaeon]